jgi:hypothetical protein
MTQKKKDCKQCKVLSFAEQDILPEELAAPLGALKSFVEA